ncbi:MAG: NADH-quinone oxidoreductase subunit A [Chloroflexi bacterium]|nr:MAG: NADH-quinone oxidoreductase subunit A [Chloroflexota bacterium]MBA4374805.1 NADH-quinone oxidoreductase subunit A [Anaerolinea sp.]
MLIDYLPLFVLVVLSTLVGFFVLVLGRFFGPHRPTSKKGQPYESGMIPYGPGTRQMTVRYYLIAVLFILFDVEVIFFLPWAVAFKQLGLFALIEMFLFVSILMVGFIYVWKKGALEWE